MPDIKIPELSRFCCFELKPGVKYTSLVLGILWLLALISSFVGSGIGNIIWNIIWCVASIIIFGMVYWGIHKDKPRTWLLPACIVAPINGILCVLTAIIAFISLNWFGAIIYCIEAGLVLYYFLGVYTVYKSMTAPTGNVEPA
eukprot:TRINITY_DN950_c0_g1_i10.p1 TRINITY_DN950_c0_g1~~TRINITY_DN950_c0_g1_i10.p1  ORF type:complete len:157 (-),score=16.05 TRINITY_DN950_c0_g1_i10:175-603(-)